MSSPPLVSAIVSTYNRWQRLMGALDSVARQTYPALEVIVVNDGSTEPEYASAPRPAVAKWIDLPQNTRATHGFPCLGHVRNVGIAQARGEYLAFLDDDDLWLPEKTERQIAAIHGTDVRMCCTEVFDGDGAPVEDLRYPRYYRDQLRLSLPPFLTAEHLSRQNYITHASVILHRSLFAQAGPYLEIPLQGHLVDGERVVEDWALWRSCMRFSRCRFLPEPLVYYDSKSGKLRRPWYRARIATARALRDLLGLHVKIPVGY